MWCHTKLSSQRQGIVLVASERIEQYLSKHGCEMALVGTMPHRKSISDDLLATASGDELSQQVVYGEAVHSTLNVRIPQGIALQTRWRGDAERSLHTKFELTTFSRLRPAMSLHTKLCTQL